MGVWQSYHIDKRLLRRFTPRNDILLIALELVSSKYPGISVPFTSHFLLVF